MQRKTLPSRLGLNMKTTVLVLANIITIFVASKAYTQITSEDQMRQSVYELIIATEKQGLVARKYQPLQTILTSLINTGRAAQVQKLSADLIMQVSSDFATGQVKAGDLNRNHMIPTKKLQKIQHEAVNQYIMGQLSPPDLLQILMPKNFYYTSLVATLQRFQQTISSGQASIVPSKLKTIKPSAQDEESILYARFRLALLGYTNDQSTPVLTEDLTDSIYEFQTDHKLAADGVLGPASWAILNQDIGSMVTKLRLNIDRTRWLPDNLGTNHVFVNLAEQKLKLVLSGQQSMAFKTINGRLDRQTPLLFDSMSHLFLNPTWTVPQSILLKDKIPSFIENPQAVVNLKMNVINDLTGAVEDPFTIDWSKIKENYSPYTLVQKPGKHNALGFIKFPLTNPYAIYLHDTNSRELFSSAERLFSSGCVRLEKPFEFAEKIINSISWNAETLRAASEYLSPEANESTKIRFKAIPIYLFYLTTAVNEQGKTIVSNDAYGLDTDMHTILTKQ